MLGPVQKVIELPFTTRRIPEPSMQAKGCQARRVQGPATSRYKPMLPALAVRTYAVVASVVARAYRL
jgi:hypothetical protein